MSDDSSEDDSEGYEFQYSDSEDEMVDDGNVDIENCYYDSKSSLEDGNLEQALDGFRKVLELEKSAGGPDKWGFKAHRELTIVLYRKFFAQKQNDDEGKRDDYFQQMKDHFSSLLSYAADRVVDKTTGEQGINDILDTVTGCKSFELLQDIYQMTLNSLLKSNNGRLWLKTTIKLGKVYFDLQQYGRLRKVLRDLQKSMDFSERMDAVNHNPNVSTTSFSATSSSSSSNSGQVSAGRDDEMSNAGGHSASSSIGSSDSNSSGTAAGTSLTRVPSAMANIHMTGADRLEIYALTIMLHTVEEDNKKLKAVYQKALQIRSAVCTRPRTVGIIRECGGKMLMRERQWAEARNDFFEAFKSYAEADDPRRISCLKYLVLANMLSQSSINPFDAHEAKPYEQHRDIKAMTELISAFMDNDLYEFQRIMLDHNVRSDEFMATYIDDLLTVLRTQVLLETIKPYTRIHLSSIQEKLDIETLEEVERLLVKLILDKKLEGKVDQIRGELLLTGDFVKKKKDATAQRKYDETKRLEVMMKNWQELLDIGRKSLLTLRQQEIEKKRKEQEDPSLRLVRR
eukprot:g3116.t1